MVHVWYMKNWENFSLCSKFEFFEKPFVKYHFLLDIYIVPMSNKHGKVKNVLGILLLITLNFWTVWMELSALSERLQEWQRNVLSTTWCQQLMVNFLLSAFQVIPCSTLVLLYYLSIFSCIVISLPHCTIINLNASKIDPTLTPSKLTHFGWAHLNSKIDFTIYHLSWKIDCIWHFLRKFGDITLAQW